MGDSESDILQRAAKRGAEMGLEYAGALTPDEAHRLAQEAGGRIVDVRTVPELQYVGQVDGAVLVQWQVYPDMEVNEKFLEELERQVPKDSVTMFLCRSGVRSHHSATLATQAGWSRSYNILEGFEGDLDENAHRSATNGWKRRGLPWKQS